MRLFKVTSVRGNFRYWFYGTASALAILTGTIPDAKADPRFFEVVIERLQSEYPGTKPEEIIFFDDSQSKVDTACSVGIDGRLYQGIHQVEALLVASS